MRTSRPLLKYIYIYIRAGFDDRAARTLWRQLVHDRWLVALNLKGNAMGAGGVHLLHASYMADATARLEAVSAEKATTASSSPSGGANEEKNSARGKKGAGMGRRKLTSKKEAHATAARRRLATAAAARKRDAKDTEALSLVGLLLDGQAGLATSSGNSAVAQVDWLGGGGGGSSGDVGGGGGDDQLRAAVANFRAHVARVREANMGVSDSAEQDFDDQYSNSSASNAEDEFTHLAEAAVGGSDAVIKYAESSGADDQESLLSPVAALASNPLLGNALKVCMCAHMRATVLSLREI